MGLIITEYFSSKEFGFNGKTPYIMSATCIAVLQIFLAIVVWNRSKNGVFTNVTNLILGMYSLVISVAAYFWYISWL